MVYSRILRFLGEYLPMLSSISRQDVERVAIQSAAVDVSVHGDTSWSLPDTGLEALPFVEVVLADTEESGAGCVGILPW